MTQAWHFLGSSTLAQLGKLTLREDAWRLPTGNERRYPVLHVGLTVGVVPFVDPDHVLLIRQFRHLTRSDSWELPGGGGQPGEDPETAAQRELREEGGYRAGRLIFKDEAPCPVATLLAKLALGRRLRILSGLAAAAR